MFTPEALFRVQFQVRAGTSPRPEVPVASIIKKPSGKWKAIVALIATAEQNIRTAERALLLDLRERPSVDGKSPQCEEPWATQSSLFGRANRSIEAIGGQDDTTFLSEE
jgi:hypothetical protein